MTSATPSPLASSPKRSHSVGPDPGLHGDSRTSAICIGPAQPEPLSPAQVPEPHSWVPIEARKDQSMSKRLAAAR